MKTPKILFNVIKNLSHLQRPEALQINLKLYLAKNSKPFQMDLKLYFKNQRQEFL